MTTAKQRIQSLIEETKRQVKEMELKNSPYLKDNILRENYYIMGLEHALDYIELDEKEVI